MLTYQVISEIIKGLRHDHPDEVDRDVDQDEDPDSKYFDNFHPILDGVATAHPLEEIVQDHDFKESEW